MGGCEGLLLWEDVKDCCYGKMWRTVAMGGCEGLLLWEDVKDCCYGRM